MFENKLLNRVIENQKQWHIAWIRTTLPCLVQSTASIAILRDVFGLLLLVVSFIYIFFGRCSSSTLGPNPWGFCSKYHLTICNLSFHFHKFFKHFLFFNFSFWKTLRLIKKCCRNSTKHSHTPFIQIPQMSTPYTVKTGRFYLNFINCPQTSFFWIRSQSRIPCCL